MNRLSAVCKALSGNFIWRNILHFDNGSYVSPERCEKVSQQLLKHVDNLTRFESLIISEKGDADVLNTLIRRLAPQLRRFGRHIYTILIAGVNSLFEALETQNLEKLDLQATDSNRLESFFKSNSFPNLKHLSVSEDEPAELVDYFSDDTIQDVRPVRPLLQNIASSTGSLEVFEVMIANTHDKDGLVFNSIKDIVSANKETLRILDVGACTDTEGRFVVSNPYTTSRWLDTIFDGARYDSYKWRLLPGYISSTFGVDISCFRVFGASVWQLVFLSEKHRNGAIPSLEHIQGLFDAVYPPRKTSPAARIKSFETFLASDVHQTMKFFFDELNAAMRTDYLSWMIEEIRSALKVMDLRSVHLESVLLGLFGVLSFCDSCELPVDDIRQHIVEVASVANPDFPWTACFQLLESKFEFQGCIRTSMLVNMLIKYRRDLKVDISAPVGIDGDPLIVFLRDRSARAFEHIVTDPAVFNPVQMHPTRHVPLLLFALLEPGRGYCFRHSGKQLVVDVIWNLLLKNLEELEGTK
jgi:hypothetical protein